MKKDCHLDLWVDCDLELALRRLAEEDDRKLSAYMRIVLERHVEDCDNLSRTKPAANLRNPQSTEPNREGRIRDLANRERRRIGVPGMPSEDE